MKKEENWSVPRLSRVEISEAEIASIQASSDPKEALVRFARREGLIAAPKDQN